MARVLVGWNTALGCERSLGEKQSSCFTLISWDGSLQKEKLVQS